MTKMAGRDIWLNDNDVCTEAPAVVEVINGLAGRARIAYELASGEVPSDEQPLSGYNPQGLVGVDCSGPPWGSAHLHPIAWMGGQKPNSATFSSRPSSALLFCAATAPRGISWVVWVRPHEKLPLPYIAPLSRAYINVRGYLSAATAVDLTCKAWSNGDRVADALSDSVTLSASTSVQGVEFTRSALWVSLRPGRNIIQLGFETSSTTVGFYLTSMCLLHGVKRSH